MKKPIQYLIIILFSIVSLSSQGNNRLPKEQREIIHFLAEHHEEMTREVTLTEDGYMATTTSENEEVVNKLHEHLEFMLSHLKSGKSVRNWDPAFVELREYYDQIDTQYEKLDNGLKVIISGKNEEAILVVQNHAKIVSGFVDEGREAVRSEHEPALKK